MTKKEVRRIRQDTAARTSRSSNGAIDHHTTLTRRQTAAWFAAGALASCAAFAAILWLWVVPAMDAALAAVQGAVA